MTVKDVEWPDISPKVEAPNCLLPDGVVEMFARAAQIVNRNEPRAILRGINLSSDGITVTNGKELLNYDCPRKLTTRSLQEIAGEFDKTHATVLHGAQTIQKRLDVEPDLKKSMEDIVSRMGRKASDILE